MHNLFDILASAQNGQAIPNIARQFELNQKQVLAAVEALLPAFSLGFKRQAESIGGQTSPLTFFGLTGLPEIDAFHDAALGFTQQAMQQGLQVITALFGSSEITGALARQAAMQSGVAAPVISAMLPVFASILVSGLASAAVPALPVSPMADMIDGMMRTLQPKSEATKSEAAKPQIENPLLALWAPFLDVVPKPKPETSVKGSVLSRMLDAGVETQKVQAKAMQALFDTWMGKK